MSNASTHEMATMHQLTEHLKQQLPLEQYQQIQAFVRIFYGTISVDDLASRVLVDITGATLSFWKFCEKRQLHEVKLRVYNPEYPSDGWQSNHTIAEVIMEDMPFLVDSLRMELQRRGFEIHQMIHVGGMKVKRDKAGILQKVYAPEEAAPSDAVSEAPIYIEFDKETDLEMLDEIKESLGDVLDDVRVAVQDWPKMIQRVEDATTELNDKNRTPSADTLAHYPAASPVPNSPHIPEAVDLLAWLRDNFIFLGSCLYVLNRSGDGCPLEPIAHTGLGLLQEGRSLAHIRKLSELPKEAESLLLSDEPIIIARTNYQSTVHRPAFCHVVFKKIFNKKGEVIGVCRFIGLFTSAAYHSSPSTIPFVRGKVAAVIKQSGLTPQSHDGKSLNNILDTLPRHDLFETSVQELFDLAMGIMYLQERQRIRLFLRKDAFGRFYSCLVFVPRERFNSVLRQKMQDILMKELDGNDATFETRFSESVLARIHFTIRIESDIEKGPVDVDALQQLLIEVARNWDDELREALVDKYGEENGLACYTRFGAGFPASFRETFLARAAVIDVEHMLTLQETNTLAMSFYKPIVGTDNALRFKLFRLDQPIPLSDVVPMLENMGVRVLAEHPYQVTQKYGDPIWLNDFELLAAAHAQINVDELKVTFQDAFANIWAGNAENDGFNRLVLMAGMSWREIVVLRAYSRYLRQTGFTFSQTYIEQTLIQHASLAKALMDLFKLRFSLTRDNHVQEEIEFSKNKILQGLDSVSNIDEDRILRRYLDVIMATLRTNFYQEDAEGNFKPYISFKFNPKMVPELPLPVPKHEIFVYSTRMEGVHLRGADVARGGIRWSDRKEDYRTEVLGLMKAQQVKNAVIVPLGAKGGFVCKALPMDGNRDELMSEVIACYQTLIRGMLDITDNIVEGLVVPPENVARFDGDDPYLVVAADKGTATFSDIANALSQEYGFWLGDAFASGGSAGYDHKKMGITARGCWESVKRHFRELGIDVHATDFTVVGIGDMAGDVFGNGMLMSPHIKLVGAFNHKHIFIDPNPDAALSFKERERLFNLPRSGWTDYAPELISKGGGVFERSAKSIKLTPEMQEVFQIKRDTVQPNELIRSMLTAPIDLLWNGGIGTFVKAAKERDADVGDKANDPLRVNGQDLRVRVVGEGGNLGFTQLGRVEYSLQGGLCNTDAIDNSAGVDCSDHEVNIKILLNDVVSNGDMTEKQRNILLAEMTDEVAQLVLRHNREQTEAISVALATTHDNVEMHIRLLNELEATGSLDRALEFLPTSQELSERKAHEKGLTRPEISVLVGYVKTWLKQQILNSDLPEANYIGKEISGQFPRILSEKFLPQMQRHRLRREIIATELSNSIVNDMGISLIQRLRDETGALGSDIVLCYWATKEIFEIDLVRKKIASLNNVIKASVQIAMLGDLNRLVRRCTRWFLRNQLQHQDIESIVHNFAPGIREIASHINRYVSGEVKVRWDAALEQLLAEGVPNDLAYRVASLPAMYSALDIVAAAGHDHASVDEVASLYFDIGSRLDLDWMREKIKQHPVNNHWDAMARAAFRDDLDRQQRTLTVSVLTLIRAYPVENAVDMWMRVHEWLIKRWDEVLNDLKSQNKHDFVMFAVALRELLDLAHASQITASGGTDLTEADVLPIQLSKNK